MESVRSWRRKDGLLDKKLQKTNSDDKPEPTKSLRVVVIEKKVKKERKS